MLISTMYSLGNNGIQYFMSFDGLAWIIKGLRPLHSVQNDIFNAFRVVRGKNS